MFETFKLLWMEYFHLTILSTNSIFFWWVSRSLVRKTPKGHLYLDADHCSGSFVLIMS